MSGSVLIRFYEELNTYLPPENYKRTQTVDCPPACPVGDLIASFGIPLGQVDLVLVNGESVPFEHPLVPRDRVSVYPVFESFDIGPVNRIRKTPLRNIRFVADVHLGRLAKYLRMLGFDTLYENDFTDEVLVYLSASDRRILLSRDRQLMADPAITRGYQIRQTDPRKQLIAVLQRFDLIDQVHPLTRCLRCNGPLIQCDPLRVQQEVLSTIRFRYRKFKECSGCRKIYWNGDHANRMKRWIRRCIDQIA